MVLSPKCVLTHSPDFVNGWEPAALKNALDYCHCNPYGDPSCCVAQGLFTFDQKAKCYITDSVEEKGMRTPLATCKDV